MTLNLRILFTALGVLGLGLTAFLLFHAGRLAWSYMEILFGDATFQPQYRMFGHFMGIASTIGSVILIVGFGLIAWLLVRLWREGFGSDGDASGR